MALFLVSRLMPESLSMYVWLRLAAVKLLHKKVQYSADATANEVAFPVMQLQLSTVDLGLSLKYYSYIRTHNP